MKKLYTLLLTLLITSSIYAQAPELMSYQAIVRDADDALIQNGNIGIRISILQGSDTGTAVYTETHTTTTNDNGLVSLDIGSGSTSGDFSSIDWSTGTYYIKSETDPNGGTSYSIEGTSQLLSVPYALYANSTESIEEGALNNIQIPANNVISTSNFVMNDSEADMLYAYSGSTGTWSFQPTSEFFSSSSIIPSNGSFIMNDSQADMLYAFGAAGVWSSQATSEFFSSSSIIESNGYFIMNDSEVDILYAYSGTTGTWSSQPTSEFFSSSSIIPSNGSFIMNDSQADIIYAYSGTTGNWSSQATSEFFSSSSIIESNGYFIMNDGEANIIYAYSGKTGTWSSQATSEFFSSSSIISSGN